MAPSIFLRMYLSIDLSIHPSICLLINQWMYAAAYLSIYLSVVPSSMHLRSAPAKAGTFLSTDGGQRLRPPLLITLGPLLPPLPRELALHCVSLLPPRSLVRQQHSYRWFSYN